MQLFDENNLTICGLVTIGMQLLFFLMAALCRLDKITDLAGGVNFTAIAVTSFCLAQVSKVYSF